MRIMHSSSRSAMTQVWAVLLCTLTSAMAQSEKDILMEFYDSLDGNRWKDNTGWTEGKICDWKGITCFDLENPNSAGNEGVVKIDLESNDLNGDIPESFWSLPYLSQVQLGGNSISDAGFTGFSKDLSAPVTEIILSDNSIISIEGIGNAPSSLRTLHMTNNRISDEIPPELFELNMLRRLYLSFNEFSGEIPTEIGNMAGLREMFFYGNWLTGYLPSELGMLDNLEIVTFAENQLSGEIPTEVQNMRNLRVFSLHNNDPESGEHWGELPNFEDLIFLTELYLDGNAFSGQIPSRLLGHSNVTSELVTLGLSNNMLTGTVPGTLTHFKNLFIDVTGNFITGVSPRVCRQNMWMNGQVELYGCDAILCPPGTANSVGRQDAAEDKCVQCSGPYTGEDRNFLGQYVCPEDYDDDYGDDTDDIKILMDLYFTTGGPTQWTNSDGWEEAFADVDLGDTVDDIPDDTFQNMDICEFYGVGCGDTGEVENLYLGDNNLQGLLPDNIFQLPKLKRLDLGGNNVWFEEDNYGFGNIGQAAKLKFLNVSSSGVESWDNIADAWVLEELYMTNSWITGEIPDDFFVLDSLQVFHCVFCGLEGELSPLIGGLTNLKELVLYGNELSGEIPSEVGELAELANLDLSENDFSGEIPEEINNCQNLLHFSAHQETAEFGLTGEVPSFSGLTKIETIDLSHNSLSGPIPDSFLEGVKQARVNAYISVNLADNEISGFSSSLVDFTNMNLVLVDNSISSAVPEALCDDDHNDWMNGMVLLARQEGLNPCDSILCPAGTFNEDGRLSPDKDCKDCSSCLTLGCTLCENDSESTLETVYSILNELYTATQGKRWFNNENWLKAGASVCDFSGVECKYDLDGDLDGVVALDLQSAGLDGTVPTSIYQLPGLERLNLSNNDIKLSFIGIENAANLNLLHLSGTSLDSMEGIEEAPASLKELHLAQCDFEGEIPSEFFQLSGLQRVFLNFNRFSGELPQEIGQMTNLEEFWCFNNDLTGSLPTQLGNLEQLMVLALDENKLSGFLPTELESMPSLQKLNLGAQRSRKQIHGPLLSFSSSSNLDNLGLGGNSLEGPIPSDFLDNVDRNINIKVDLSFNALTGAVPLSLDQFNNLDINLVENKIDALDEAFCDNNGWMNGAVANYNCDAILCPKHQFSSRGRQVDGSITCKDCPPGETTLYMGSTSCHKGGTIDEREILTQIYKALNGTNWIKQRKWNSDDPICNWYGIECDDKHGNSGVKRLELPNNNLEAVLPSAEASKLIFKLPLLQNLNVKGNKFALDFSTAGEASFLKRVYVSGTGIESIKGIGKAKTLKEIHLTDNNLSGPFPDELLELTNLELLYISFNKFSGELPSEINKLTELRDLYAFQNDFSGQIPPQIGELTKIEKLIFGLNKFSGRVPQEIDNLTNLQELGLNDQQGSNKLSGPLPSLAAAQKLVYLDLGKNSFTGSIPADFLRDKAATQEDMVINLSFNQLTGNIPESLDKFSTLDLGIVANKFDNIPMSLCDSDNAAWMDGSVGEFIDKDVEGCDAIACPQGTFSDSGKQDDPDDPCMDCPSLQLDPTIGNTICEGLESEMSILMSLYYDTNGDRWDWNDGWGTAAPICSWDNVVCANGSEQDDKGVTDLLLGDNNLVGTVPSKIFMLRRLKTLDIKENIDVTISFDKISEAKRLKLLYLSDTALEDITGIGNAPNLEELHLTDNDIVGEFPDDFYNLAPTLKELYIAYNAFYGDLSKFTSFTKLEQFYAFNNDFSGPIPSEFGKLKNLQNLILSENVLSGAIPEELGSLPNLKILSLYRRLKSGPRLSGPLPSFSKMPALTDLYLDYNDITGSIPSDFVSSSSGTLLITLAHNFITGAVPSELETIEELDILLEGNQITDLPESFCDKSVWMEGDVGKYGCDALLCEIGYASIYGRQNTTDSECKKCDDPLAAPFWGSTSCDVNLALDAGGEKKIIELLYDKCGGDKWWNKALWKENDDVCSWYGIECTEKGTVRSIRLGSNNLAGTPPQEIFDLPDLNSLWLNSNPIQFSFVGIESARHLTELRLDSTGIASIAGVKNAKSLKILDLRFNRISGPFPVDLLYLPNLESLSLADNDLIGPLPTSFQGMPDINTLHLGSNAFTGLLPSFGDLEYLRVLDLSDNKLTGSIPQTFLVSLPKSSKILVDLSTNQLTGSIPLGLDSFEKLTIYLRNNEITKLPSILCDGDDDNDMQDGQVADFGCDAFLCPPGTFNQLGRQSSGETPCVDCPDPIEYYGQTSCPSISLDIKSGAESLMSGRVGKYASIGALAGSLFWLALEIFV